MPEIALFVEDDAHRNVIETLVRRIAGEYGVRVQLDWRNATGGYGRVISEFDGFLRDLKRQGAPWPDLLIVATDANCKGLNERAGEIGGRDDVVPVILALPDPHIERWLLLDGAAFKAVFGRGCDAPDLKCDRNHYKQRLIEAIHATGVRPSLGGIEYAEDIMREMDFDRAARVDRSFGRFVADLRRFFQGWQS